MSSSRSRFFIFMLQNRHLLRLKRKRRASIDFNTPVAALRADAERGARMFGKLPHGISVEPTTVAGLYGEWLVPAGAGKARVILYFHGGGLVMGSVRSHRAIVAKFVQGSGIAALLFDYSLAPERPFPHGLDDAVNVYKYLLSKGTNPEDIVFMGDSGGGNLALAALLALKEQELPQPAAAVTLSAWTDLTNSGESFVTNTALDKITVRDAQIVFSAYYAGDNDVQLPLISPLFGDLRGLPPLLMYAGGAELMRDDTTRFARRAKQAGVAVTAHIGEGLFHCYPALAPLFPEATAALNEICAFIKGHVSTPTALTAVGGITAA